MKAVRLHAGIVNDDPILHHLTIPNSDYLVQHMHHQQEKYIAATTYISNNEAYNNSTTHMSNNESYANAVIDKETGIALEYQYLSTGPEKTTWIRALANNIGRLAQGVGNRICGKNTIFFVHP